MFKFFQKEPINVEGNWVGFYKYDSKTSAELNLLKVRFEAHISMNGHEIIGEIIDDPTSGGLSIPSKISGFVKGSQLFFNKTYPNRVVANDQGHFQSIENEESQVIMYRGAFNRKVGRVKGIWEIDEVHAHRDNGKKIRVYSSGLWEMRKI